MSRDTIAMSHKDIAMLGLLVMSIGLLIGYATGTEYHSGKAAVMEQYSAWSLQEQQDFILAAIQGKNTLKRTIAEDWCAINWKTERVCRNARMSHPIRVTGE